MRNLKTWAIFMKNHKKNEFAVKKFAYTVLFRRCKGSPETSQSVNCSLTIYARDLGWSVHGKIGSVSPNENFIGETGFLER